MNMIMIVKTIPRLELLICLLGDGIIGNDSEDLVISDDHGTTSD